MHAAYRFQTFYLLDLCAAASHADVQPAGPAGSGRHSYYITVTALVVERSGVDAGASAAYVGFVIGGHTVARATLVCPTPAADA
jgi:Phosphatidylethanolamine-binding protein